MTKIGFILQYGYCKATGQCYTSATYRAADIAYVCKQLGLPLREKQDEQVSSADMPSSQKHYSEVIEPQKIHAAAIVIYR